MRMNFSHGTHDVHRRVYHDIRDVAQRCGRPIAILQDLQGPKLRVGELAGDLEVLKEGATLRSCTTPIVGDASRVSTTYPKLADDVRVGDQILLDDGKLELRVTGIEDHPGVGREVATTVINGGDLRPRKGIPVITATQMLESMIEESRPTRAEASDVANATFDGPDAVMLSAETATSAYPIEAVWTMARIASAVEHDPDWRHGLPANTGATSDARAAAVAACSLANALGAPAIAVLTETGGTARHVSQTRPGIPILAFSANECVANALALWHGVVPVVEPLDGSIEDMVTEVAERTRAMQVASSGNTIVIVGAVPRRNGRSSVFLEIHRLA